MSTRAERMLILGFVAGLLVVAGYVGWIGASAWQASKVGITAAELIECADPSSVVPAGKRLHRDEEPEDRTGPAQAIYLDRRLDCILRTQVVSDARVAV